MSAAEDLDQHFLAVMGGVCAPVVVVTTLADGEPFGSTVSAFASLSRRPPMVTVALDNGSGLLHKIRESERFAINVLSESQSDIALTFATKGADKFSETEWEDHGGAPRINGSTGWLLCDVASFVEGGDHTILLGSVVAAEDSPDAPLIYHRRTFGTHASLMESAIARSLAADEAASEPLWTTFGDVLDVNLVDWSKE
ncbi:MAG: flavin reductase family protein [Micrococcales bacterium]|nr:flavin reductase family protein [Micrococcales bacterium]